MRIRTVTKDEGVDVWDRGTRVGRMIPAVDRLGRAYWRTVPGVVGGGWGSLPAKLVDAVPEFVARVRRKEVG